MTDPTTRPGRTTSPTAFSSATGTSGEELKAREAAARRYVKSLVAQLDALKGRLQASREKRSRLRVTRETVTGVMAEISTLVLPEARTPS